MTSLGKHTRHTVLRVNVIIGAQSGNVRDKTSTVALQLHSQTVMLVCVFVTASKWELNSETDDVKEQRSAGPMTLQHSNERGNDGTWNTTRRDGSGNEEINLQAPHLPRKAPKDTLPMPVVNIQKQKKCSRKRVSAVHKRSSEEGRRKRSNRGTELRAELRRQVASYDKPKQALHFLGLTKYADNFFTIFLHLVEKLFYQLNEEIIRLIITLQVTCWQNPVLWNTADTFLDAEI